MKIVFFLSLISLLITSCQTPQKTVQTPRFTASEGYQAQIKSDKKKQAELDLPFRGFSPDKVIQTIAFGSAASNCWQTIEKNKPELMILTSTPLINLSKVTEYRSIREKVPFLCTSNVESKSEILKDCPYVKNIIPDNQDGTYHSQLFGNKKHQLLIVMMDHLDSEKKWSWLENELKKPSDLKILSGPTQDYDRLLGLIKKIKQKNLILIPNDRPLESLAKTDIKEIGALYEAQPLNRNVSAESNPMNFGMIKINWSNRIAQLEVRDINDQKLQSINLKF